MQKSNQFALVFVREFIHNVIQILLILRIRKQPNKTTHKNARQNTVRCADAISLEFVSPYGNVNRTVPRAFAWPDSISDRRFNEIALT